MQPCPRQNKESRHRQPAHSLRIAAKAQKEVAQLGKTYAIQIEDQSIHPLGVLQPVLLSAICKTAAQSKAVPLDKLHVILFPCVVIHLPAPELLILALFVPIQIHSVRMGKIRVPFSGVLIVRKQLFIKLIASDLRILCAQILVAASIILGHITTSQKKKYQKENPLRRGSPAGGKGEKGEQKSGGYAALKRKSPPPFPPRCGALKVLPLWKTRWVYHSGLENL